MRVERPYTEIWIEQTAEQSNHHVHETRVKTWILHLGSDNPEKLYALGSKTGELLWRRG